MTLPLLDSAVEAFALHRKGHQVASLVSDLVFYIEPTFDQVASDVMAVYDAFMKRHGDDVSWYGTETMSMLKPFGAKARTSVETWFSPDAAPRVQYGLHLHSGESAEDYQAPALDLFSTSGSHRINYVRWVVPPNGVVDVERADAFVDLAVQLANVLPVQSGHGGFAVYHSQRSASAQNRAGGHAAPLLMRHRGVDIGIPMDTTLQVRDAIKGVNWLTVLGDGLCDRLGGRESVKGALASPVRVYDLDAGLLLRTGDLPALGDTNRDVPLGEYEAVNRVVRSLRLSNHRQIPGMSMDQTEEWFARFDREQ